MSALGGGPGMGGCLQYYCMVASGLRPSMGTFPWHGQLSTSLRNVSLGALGGFSLHEAPPGMGSCLHDCVIWLGGLGSSGLDTWRCLLQGLGRA